MKNLNCLFFLFLISNFGFAQFDSFNLNDYKLADFELKSLEVNSEFARSVSNTRHPDTTVSSRTFESRFELNYGFYKNSRKSVAENSFFFKIEPRIDFQPGRTTKNIPAAFAHEFQKTFYNQKNRFWAIGSFSNAAIGQNSDKSFDTNFKQQNYNYRTGVELKIGKGRLENITDVWQAHRIFENLNEVNRLKVLPTDSLVIQLGSLISKRRNFRFFDSRYKRINDLSLLDDYLQNTGLITQPDIVYFNSINDLWSHGSGGQRLSGSEISLHFTPSIFQDFIERDTIFTRKITRTYLTSGLAARRAKALNVKWHLDTETGLDFSYRNQMNFLSDPQREERYLIVPKISCNLQYFPSTRTFFTLNAFFNYEIGLQQSLKRKIDQRNALFGLSGSSYYYFSPRFRLRIHYSYQMFSDSTFNWDRIQNTSLRTESPLNSNFSYGFNFEYAFF